MLIATATRLYHLHATPRASEPRLWMEQETVQAVAETGPVCAAATGQGILRIWRSGEALKELDSGIREPISALMIVGADADTVMIGTEPPHIDRLHANDDRPVRMESFDRLACRKDWFTPWGGPPAVRSLAWAGESTVYADIHVGSIMRSFDGGIAWEPVHPALHQDVHQVNTSPADAERVYANTADAVWISPDRGNTWQHRPFPHAAAYGRAIAVHPEDPDCLLASVSRGPHGDDVHGRLFRSDDAGRHWIHVTDGFPGETKDNIDTHRITYDANGTAWAAAGNRLYESTDRAEHWHVAWTAPEKILKLAASM